MARLVDKPIPFVTGKMSEEEAAQRSATATKIGLRALFEEQRSMKVGLLEVLTFAFVTATVTVCMLNGLWPGHYSSCMAPDPYAGLPEELIANCTASPEDKKPAFCSQKYVGHISMATEELHAALNSYSNMHGKAIEMARQEVVEFYQARSLELDSTLQEQQKVIHSLEQAMGKLGDQLTAKTLELTRTTENLKREQKAGKQAEKAAEESKAKMTKFEQKLHAATQDLAATSKELANKTTEIQEMEASKGKLTMALSRAEASVLRLEKDNQILTASKNHLSAEAAEMKALLADQKRQVEALTQAKAALEAELIRAREKQADNLDAIMGLNARVEELTAQVKAAGEDVAAMQKQRDQKAKEVAGMEQRLNALNGTVAEIKDERDSIKEQMKEKMDETKRLEGRVADLEKKLKQQQDAWQAAQGKWEKERSDLESKLERARGLFDNFVVHNSKVQSLLLRLQSYLKTEVASIIKETDSIISESRLPVDKVVEGIRYELSV